MVTVDNSTYCAETLSSLSVTATIAGYPIEEEGLQLLHEVDGDFVMAESSRVRLSFDKTQLKLTIIIRNITRRDMGTYQIKAMNNHGMEDDFFTIVPKGKQASKQSRLTSDCKEGIGRERERECVCTSC